VPAIQFDHKRAEDMLETNQLEYLYSILDLFGREFVDDAENQSAILEGRSLPFINERRIVFISQGLLWDQGFKLQCIL
jgi:hypothetical protein